MADSQNIYQNDLKSEKRLVLNRKWIFGIIIAILFAITGSFAYSGISEKFYNIGYEAAYEIAYEDGYSNGFIDGGYDIGYEEGYNCGNADGYDAGHTSGYYKGKTEGYNKGNEEGKTEGYEKGLEEGYNNGYEKGEEEGYIKGLEEGTNQGYEKGYNSGIKDAKKTSESQNSFIKTSNSEEPINNTKTYNYILNKNTYKFHYSWCHSVDQMKEKNKIYFNGTRSQAINKGYVPCKNCNP